MFVLFEQQKKYLRSPTNQRLLFATIHLGNWPRPPGGSGDGVEIGAVLSAENGPDFIR